MTEGLKLKSVCSEIRTDIRRKVWRSVYYNYALAGRRDAWREVACTVTDIVKYSIRDAVYVMLRPLPFI